MFPKVVMILWKDGTRDKKKCYDANHGTKVAVCYSKEEVEQEAAKFVRSYSTVTTFDSVVVYDPIAAAVPVPIELKPIGSTEKVQ